MHAKKRTRLPLDVYHLRPTSGRLLSSDVDMIGGKMPGCLFRLQLAVYHLRGHWHCQCIWAPFSGSNGHDSHAALAQKAILGCKDPFVLNVHALNLDKFSPMRFTKFASPPLSPPKAAPNQTRGARRGSKSHGPGPRSERRKWTC